MDWMRRGLGLSLAFLIGFGVGSAYAGGGADRGINEIRARIRTAAGVDQVPEKDEDLPLVQVMILPGDTHQRLALDLTGSADAVAMLRRIQPVLKPGQSIYVPRAVLLPSLSDPHMEALTFGKGYPTLWTLARLVTGADGSDLKSAVRDIQRLNGILDPERISKGTKILVPRNLLESSGEGGAEGAARVRVGAAPAVIRKNYLVTDVRGLDRHRGKFPLRLRRALSRREMRENRTGRGTVSLVVLHTTEQGSANFASTASYIQRKRLANYLIGPAGGIYEIVPEAYRAFGCGDSLWEGKYEVDLEAINIEIFANTAPGEHQKSISDAQYAGLRSLLADIQSRHPAIHDGRIVTHRMVSVNLRTGTRSRKGDPYEFDWSKAGLPNNSRAIDQDVLLGRAKLCTDERYSDRVTPGQKAAARMAAAM